MNERDARLAIGAERRGNARWLATALLGALSMVLPACGSGGNDQGIVFRATGTFAGTASVTTDQITCTIPTVDTNIIDTAYDISLSRTRWFPDANDAFGDPCGGFLGLQNNLSQESMNVQLVTVRYEIPGASIEVPKNPISFGQTIPPASSTASTASGQANVILAQLVAQIVPRPIMVFLAQNANSLPETPYFMNVFITASGQSDDGTNYTTNEIGYQLTVVP